MTEEALLARADSLNSAWSEYHDVDGQLHRADPAALAQVVEKGLRGGPLRPSTRWPASAPRCTSPRTGR